MIYLDYQATTPLAPEVKAAMVPWLDHYANPHSPHRSGREAAAAIEHARGQVLAALLPPARDLDPPEWLHETNKEVLRQTAYEFGPSAPFDEESGRLVFTSGATESANWAIRGSWARRAPGRRNIVTLGTEHACVLDSVQALEEEGAEIRILPVRSNGLVSFDDVTRAVDGETALVAVMRVNNEIGVFQQVNRIGNHARRMGATMFCDAVQGFGRVPIPVGSCDLVAISGHKIHGPKGIGALWVRKGYEPAPLLHGGAQESGLRSGTLSPMLCVGFGEAARIARERGHLDLAHVEQLWRTARETLRGPDWKLNGDRVQRYKGNINIRREGLDGARLLADCRSIAFSLGSACASGSGRPSHVLRALGLSDKEARSSIRLGFGRYTSEDEVREACSLIAQAAAEQLKFAA
jgi:cysteine desulfurase